jgi:hypothetical protein
MFAFVNFKTQECYEWFFQFSFKDPWWIPKYDPYYLNGKWPLAGWLFFYFGRHTRGAVIPCSQSQISEGKKPVVDKDGNTNMEVADMICFTEQQKQEIVHTGMLVVKFKQSIMKASVALKEVFEFVKDALRKLADRISKNLWVTPRKYQGLLPKEKFKTIRRLDKCE